MDFLLCSQISPCSSCLFSLLLGTLNVVIYLQCDYIHFDSLGSEAAF